MRLIIFIILGFIGYRLVKKFFAPPSIPKWKDGRDQGEIDDIMVKDPFCNVYFPQREGIRAVINGVEYHFCSKECRDKFAEQQKNR
ncbi:MAG: hypothetical protein JRE23_06495 [Deltaproteobacteria bacterium]|nr:hypothetical protein [Deltaproteobacteria bacterium]